MGPYNLFVGDISASDDSGAATASQTAGTIDLGEVRDKFTLALGVTGGAFSPAFATLAADYIASITGTESVEGRGSLPVPIPLGSADVQLQGSLDGFSWYDLAAITMPVATADGSTIATGLAETAVVAGAPSPLARFLQAQIVFTLSGALALTVQQNPPFGTIFFQQTTVVTALSAGLSLYVAASSKV